ncbi:lytic transglycosylase domain-containing protein [Allisonella histaminiformans]|uniref:lytic transglycosylase domain-containing protein n=1 Tax=Allisonella histaminiformans TaxID=209880 RepID=UPI00307FB0CA
MAQLILINAERYKLQPELLQAVIEVESKYDEKAVSHVGAVGAMQLVPTTARWIAQESGNPYGDLKDPAINIPLGAWYLRYLINKYHGNLELALAAYNAGRGNVDTWIREKNWPDDFNDIDAIPFPETQGFVTQVIRIKEELKKKHEIQKLKAQQASVAQVGHTDKNTKVG